MIITRYAQALYEVAEEQNLRNEIMQDIETVDTILTSEPSIRNYCLKKNVEKTEQIHFVTLAFVPHITTLSQRLILTMTRNGRISHIPFLKKAFQDIYEQRTGHIRVTLEITEPPAEEFIQTLKNKLENTRNQKITIITTINTKLIGGFRLWWKDRLIDASVQGRIHLLKRHLSAI